MFEEVDIEGSLLNDDFVEDLYERVNIKGSPHDENGRFTSKPSNQAMLDITDDPYDCYTGNQPLHEDDVPSFLFLIKHDKDLLESSFATTQDVIPMIDTLNSSLNNNSSLLNESGQSIEEKHSDEYILTNCSSQQSNKDIYDCSEDLCDMNKENEPGRTDGKSEYLMNDHDLSMEAMGVKENSNQELPEFITYEMENPDLMTEPEALRRHSLDDASILNMSQFGFGMGPNEFTDPLSADSLILDEPKSSNKAEKKKKLKNKSRNRKSESESSSDTSSSSDEDSSFSTDTILSSKFSSDDDSDNSSTSEEKKSSSKKKKSKKNKKKKKTNQEKKL